MGWGAASSLSESQGRPQFTLTMIIPLMVYLESINKFTCVLLKQEVDEVEHSVHYLSMYLRGAEINYCSIKCHCLMINFAMQELSYYLLAHLLNLVKESNLLKYLLSRPAMPRCKARWLLYFNEFDIIVITPRGFKLKPYRYLNPVFV